MPFWSISEGCTHHDCVKKGCKFFFLNLDQHASESSDEDIATQL